MKIEEMNTLNVNTPAPRDTVAIRVLLPILRMGTEEIGIYIQYIQRDFAEKGLETINVRMSVLHDGV
jgi:hypothetical protein